MAVALSPQEQDKVEVKMSYQGPLIAPVQVGQTVGTVRIIVDGKAISDGELVTAGDIPAVDNMWQKAWDSALLMAFGG